MKFRFFYLLFPLFFTGCAQLPHKEIKTNNSWESQRNQLEQLTDWSLTGKLGIFSPEGRESVNINWQQSANSFHIRLSTVLGINVLDIQKVDDNLIIIDGEKYISKDPEHLITDLSGMVLPIKQLQQWIKGNPSGASYQLDDNNHLISLLGGTPTTGFWLINYADYRTIKNINLPYKLQLTSGDLRLKFRISNWEIPVQQDSQHYSQ
jgi:outer membrane lipoprotein LolB